MQNIIRFRASVKIPVQLQKIIFKVATLRISAKTETSMPSEFLAKARIASIKDKTAPEIHTTPDICGTTERKPTAESTTTTKITATTRISPTTDTITSALTEIAVKNWGKLGQIVGIFREEFAEKEQ